MMEPVKMAVSKICNVQQTMDEAKSSRAMAHSSIPSAVAEVAIFLGFSLKNVCDLAISGGTSGKVKKIKLGE
jgi:hypothetical protein